MSKAEGVRVFIFYFVSLGNFEHAFRSCVVGDSVRASLVRALLALSSALSCCVIQLEEFY